MAEWDDPAFWTSELRRAKDKRDKASSTYQWSKIRKLLTAETQEVTLHKDSNRENPTGEVSAAYVNWIWAFAQTFLPAIYWRHPKIHAYPKKIEYLSATTFVEPNINAIMRLSNFPIACRRAITDALYAGHGWIKLGWYTRFGEVPPGPGTPGKGQSTLKNAIYLKNDQPYAYRIDPEKMYVDPDAGCYEELRWIAQEYYLPYEKVMDDPYIKNKKEIAPLLPKGEEESAFLPQQPRDDLTHRVRQWARIHEIWDRDNGIVRIHCFGSGKWNRLIDPWPWRDLEGFPFKLLTLTDGVNSFYPVSPILPWLPLVEELAFVRTMRMEHMAKMVKKLLYSSGAVTEEQREMLCDPTQDVCEVTDMTQVRDFDGLKPDPNLYASEEKIKDDIREISGFSEILTGSVPFSRIAATTSAIMEKNATVRFRHYSERLADFILLCARDLFKISREYQPYPQQVQISGKPNPEWIEFTQKQIEGEFIFDLDLEDLSINTKQQRVKEAYDALAALAPFQPQVKVDSLLRDFLIAMGRTNIEDYLNPPVGPPLDPHFENQLMSRGSPVEPNPNEDFGLHLQVHTAFIQSPQYAQIIAQVPAIGQLFSEHIQKTSRMAEVMAQQQQIQTGQKAGQPASIQQGQANATAQPIGGPTNAGKGGGMEALRNIMNITGNQ